MPDEDTPRQKKHRLKRLQLRDIVQHQLREFGMLLRHRRAPDTSHLRHVSRFQAFK
jgi:hypothetical protein